MTVINYVNVLPELVLEVIFDNLTYEPETLTSCTRVSNLWNRVLRSKKQHFMFHLVVPLVARHLTYKDMLHCRLVCHNWKGAVDGVNDQVPEWDSRIDQVPELDSSIEDEGEEEVFWTPKLRLPFNASTWLPYCRGMYFPDSVNRLTNKHSFPTRIVSFYIPLVVSRQPRESELFTLDFLLATFSSCELENGACLERVFQLHGAQILLGIYKYAS